MVGTVISGLAKPIHGKKNKLMAIQKSKTLTSKITMGTGFTMTVPMWTCACDTCAEEAKKPGANPGDAHENAWKEGYRPIQIGWYNHPMKWLCKGCFAKLDAKKQN